MKDLETMKDLEAMKAQVDYLREKYKDALKRKVERLMLDLQRELKLMETDDYKPNTYGIIQGTAREIDILVAKLSILDVVDDIQIKLDRRTL